MDKKAADDIAADLNKDLIKKGLRATVYNIWDDWYPVIEII